MVLLLAGALVVWLGRHTLLTGAGALLVAEDPLAPAELIVVSNATAPADALEAVHLYRQGIGRKVVLVPVTWEPIPDEILQLGIPTVPVMDLAREILTRSGVPEDAIEMLPATVDGTETEIAAVAAFAKQRLPESLLYVTVRTHTARARWLLRRELPAGIRIMVRSPATDSFAPASWWHDREASREVAMEYLRWINTLILRDPWSRKSTAAHPAS